MLSTHISPAELAADGEQEEREEGGGQQSLKDSQDAAPRINRRILWIPLKDGRDSACANKFPLGPEIVRPGVLLVPDVDVGHDYVGGGVPGLGLLPFKAGKGKTRAPQP